MRPPRRELSSLSPHPAKRRSHRFLTCLTCLLSAGQVALADPSPAGAGRSGGGGSCPQCAYGTSPTSLVGAHDLGLTQGFGAPSKRVHLVSGETAAFSVEAIAGVSGTAMPIKIHLPVPGDGEAGAKPARRFLMLKGIPEELTLSAGFRNRSAWLVAIHEAGDLRLYSPLDYQGSFTLEVLLYRSEEHSPERQTALVRIDAPSVPPASDQTAAAPSLQPTPAREPQQAAAPAIARDEDAALLNQGKKHLADGNIVFARALFEELAARGSVQGAFAIAQTYDPVVLEQLQVIGTLGDLEKAKYWYRKAAELGNNPPLDVLSSLKKERAQD